MPLTIEERLDKIEQNKTVSARIWKIVKEVLFGLAIAGIISAGVVFYSTKNLLDKANTKVADLNAQLGVTEDHLQQFKAKVEKQDQLVQQLSRVDEARLKIVLDQVMRPEVQDAIKAARFQADISKLAKDLRTLSRQVAMIFGSAAYATADNVQETADRKNSILRNLLAEVYVVTEMMEQEQTGDIDGQNNWINADKERYPDYLAIMRGAAVADSYSKPDGQVVSESLKLLNAKRRQRKADKAFDEAFKNVPATTRP